MTPFFHHSIFRGPVCSSLRMLVREHCTSTHHLLHTQCALTDRCSDRLRNTCVVPLLVSICAGPLPSLSSLPDDALLTVCSPQDSPHLPPPW